MKKRLLTVLLAVVMAFGVFGLAACNNGEAAPTYNQDKDYNYYAVKYELEDEVRLDALTYQGVYKIFTTPGEFLLYVDSETGANAKARFQAINKLANEWGVQIQHFNPDLSGGYESDNENAVSANLLEELTGVAAESQLSAVQANLAAISNKSIDQWVDGALYAVKGADSTVAGDGSLQYNGQITAINSGVDAYKSILKFAEKRPSYGAYTEEARDIPQIGAAYITYTDTINLFGDVRLHMYQNADGADIDAIKVNKQQEKTDVYVTVANYGMFAHLIDNNEGYFAVFFGGTWCPNTQAIAKISNEIAQEKGASRIYFFDPRLDDGVRLDQVVSGAVVENKQNITGNLNTRNDDYTGNKYNYNFLYGAFLKNYLPSYRSEWNIQNADGSERFIYITVDGEKQGFTRMCVPNIMMFNGEGAGKAQIVALAEAEYYYQNVAVEGTEQHDAWKAAVEAVFDANPWLEIERAEAEANKPQEDAGSSNAGDAGSSNGGGSSAPVAPPAGDEGGC